ALQGLDTIARPRPAERLSWGGVFLYGQPLVLKSSGHTCRIRLLLELFPDAKFVHIHRNPYAVFQSTRRTVLKVSPWSVLQRPDHSDLDDRTIRQYKEVYDVFLRRGG